MNQSKQSYNVWESASKNFAHHGRQNGPVCLFERPKAPVGNNVKEKSVIILLKLSSDTNYAKQLSLLRPLSATANILKCPVNIMTSESWPC